jgi:integrase
LGRRALPSPIYRLGFSQGNDKPSVGYGAVLPASEVVALKVDDINSGRTTIRVEQGKGGKDRCALFSQSLLEVLQACWREGKAGGQMLPQALR